MQKRLDYAHLLLETISVYCKENGAVENFPIKGAFWAKAETHEVINVSSKSLRFYIIETK